MKRAWMLILLTGCLAENPVTRASHHEVVAAAQTVCNAIAWAQSAAAERRSFIELRIRAAEHRFISAEETAPGVFSLIPDSERVISSDVTIASVEGAARGVSEGDQVVRFPPRGQGPRVSIKLVHKNGAWRTVHLEENGRFRIEEPPLE